MLELSAPQLPQRRARVAQATDHWRTMVVRCVRLSGRNVDAVVTALVLPLMLLVLFVELFGGAIHTGTRYITYVVPGVLVLSAGFGSASTAVSVTQDMTTGVIDRFRSLDVSATAILAGHVVASIVRNLTSTILVLGVSLLLGFRPHSGIGGAVAAGGILLAFILSISWVAAVVGLAARSVEAANGFTFVLVFLPYPSSAFVPLATLPTWVRGFARHQPVTPVVESLRALLLDHPTGSHPWVALAWCAGLLVTAILAGHALFAQRTA